MNNRQILALPLARIDVGDRLRPVDPAAVELLALSFQERGQDTPITVRASDVAGNFLLVAGAHRYAAASAIGWERMDAMVIEASDDEARLAEIDENLMRRELSALDRAVFLATRQDVYERMHPTAAHGKAPKNKGLEKRTSLSSFPLSFAEATAERLGLDPRTIRRAVSRTRIAADVRLMIAGHPVAESGAELDKLAGLTEAQQRLVAGLLTRADKPARTVGAALAEMAGPVTPNRGAEAQSQLKALMSAWKKAGRVARKQFLEHLELEGEVTLPEQKGRGA